jgi:hypothetical protein
LWAASEYTWKGFYGLFFAVAMLLLHIAYAVFTVLLPALIPPSQEVEAAAVRCVLSLAGAFSGLCVVGFGLTETSAYAGYAGVLCITTLVTTISIPDQPAGEAGASGGWGGVAGDDVDTPWWVRYSFVELLQSYKLEPPAPQLLLAAMRAGVGLGGGGASDEMGMVGSPIPSKSELSQRLFVASAVRLLWYASAACQFFVLFFLRDLCREHGVENPKRDTAMFCLVRAIVRALCTMLNPRLL